jgi:AraC-like DNA-binding protein
VIASSAIRDLIEKDATQYRQKELLFLSRVDEEILKQLYSQLESNWQNAEFDGSEYGQSMAMSRSQLYRKSISLTGQSPNVLLKDFRLKKAKELMKKRGYTIAQVTFESGFTSPSYFTKCFKKKYGVLPGEYLEQLQ